MKIERAVCYSRLNNFICITKFNIQMQSGSIHYRSFFDWWSSIHCKLWNISMSFYHTTTSFPVQLIRCMNILQSTRPSLPTYCSYTWPNEVIAMKDASAPASDYKPCSRYHSKIPDSLLNTSITKATTEHHLEPTAPTSQPQKLSP